MINKLEKKKKKKQKKFASFSNPKEYILALFFQVMIKC